VWRSGYANVTVLPVAAYDRLGHVRMTLNRENRGGSHLLTGGDVLVPCARLDDLLPAIGVDHVDLVKIDAEGTDHLALRGLERTLERTGATAVVEVLPALADLGGDRTEDVLAYYWSLPVRRLVIGAGGALRPVATPAEVLEAAAGEDWLNLVLAPSA
jgi:Methyltransferase FkbM domain